jgi:hypothetical protein
MSLRIVCILTYSLACFMVVLGPAASQGMISVAKEAVAPKPYIGAAIGSQTPNMYAELVANAAIV